MVKLPVPLSCPRYSPKLSPKWPVSSDRQVELANVVLLIYRTVAFNVSVTKCLARKVVNVYVRAVCEQPATLPNTRIKLLQELVGGRKDTGFLDRVIRCVTSTTVNQVRRFL
jgi:hypothetical protein